MMDDTSRRGALKCLGVGAGTLFTLSSGIFSAVDLAQAATTAQTGTPLFVQISDTHIGFNKDANPDVIGTLNRRHRPGERAAAAARASPSIPATSRIFRKREEFDHRAADAASDCGSANCISCPASTT